MSDPDTNTALEDLLGAITRDDGSRKYTTAEDAIKALATSQQHISNLESENKTYREQLGKLDTIEQTLEKMNQGSKDLDQDPKKTQDSNDAELDLSKLDELIAQKIAENVQKTSKQRNAEEFTTKLSAMYGDNPDTAFAKRAQDLGLSTDFINEVAATSPKAALKLLEEKVEVPAQHSADGDKPTRFEKPNEIVNVANMNSRQRISVIEDRIRQLTSGGN